MGLIHIAKFYCEKYCCLESTNPLIVFKEITIHKLQGVGIGPGNYWDTVVVILPANHNKTRLGIELVVFSRPISKESVTIQDYYGNGVTVGYLKSIYWSISYYDRKNFQNLIWEQVKKMQACLISQIVELDHNNTTSTFKGGVDYGG